MNRLLSLSHNGVYSAIDFKRPVVTSVSCHSTKRRLESLVDSSAFITYAGQREDIILTKVPDVGIQRKRCVSVGHFDGIDQCNFNRLRTNSFISCPSAVNVNRMQVTNITGIVSLGYVRKNFKSLRENDLCSCLLTVNVNSNYVNVNKGCLTENKVLLKSNGLFPGQGSGKPNTPVLKEVSGLCVN